ncbi:MAG: thiazole synthase [Dehalococcoidia bacterium]|jgi:thiazole synthase|nr:thiazole synthase [Dehalococcoidia bacterium]|tara:strand:- start:879 stop:1664 length:786 start_codon:yes stop_codon:yes gene_type:complete
MVNDQLKIGEKVFSSRLLLGTGRHRNDVELQNSLKEAGTEIVTVAIRRLDLTNPNTPSILDSIDPNFYTILPNTAGCSTVEEVVMIAKLSRSMGLPNWIKLEVIPDPKYLLPDPVGTLEAAKVLIKEGFDVMPYINADPVLARHLEEIGCVTVMPLGSAIGSGQGIHTAEEISIIIEQAKIPVIVDAGLAVPSHASQAMEMGADAVLVNTAIARAKNPQLMAGAFRLGVEAGRKAFLAGRIERQQYAQASSPLEGVINASK